MGPSLIAQNSKNIYPLCVSVFFLFINHLLSKSDMIAKTDVYLNKKELLMNREQLLCGRNYFVDNNAALKE